MSTGMLTRDRPAPAKRGAPVPMDPRVKARRVEVARDRGRRRRRRLGVLVLITLVVAGAIGVTQSPLLDVDRVTVTGAGQTGPAAVRAATGVRIGRPLLAVDVAASERRLEALPWVIDAHVARQWPSTLRVTVTERVPVAIAGSGATAVLVDRSGAVLGPAGAVANRAHLPTVPMRRPPAPGGQLAPRARAIVAMLDRLPTRLARQVTKGLIRSDGLGLVLNDGVRVRLGDGARLEAKSDAVLVLLEQADRDTIDTIDVSVKGSAALTRHKAEGA